MAKLKSTLPKGIDANGLGPVASRMIRDPHKLHAVIAIVSCTKTEIDHDLEETIPVIQVRRIEGILPEDFPAAERLLRRAMEYRTGRNVLPLQLEDDINAAFNRADHADDDS